MTDSVNLDVDTFRILIAKARDGEQSAQSELAVQVQSYLTMMADRNLNDSIRANVGPSDIVQQTLIQMVNGIEKFRGETTPEFYGWLNRIIKNEARKTKRDLNRQKRDIRRQTSLHAPDENSGGPRDPAAGILTPKSSAIARERIAVFHQALQRLSDDHATVIRLRNLDQLSFKEIAEKMERTVDSVTKMWYRAVLKFEKELESLNDNTCQ